MAWVRVGYFADEELVVVLADDYFGVAAVRDVQLLEDVQVLVVLEHGSAMYNRIIQIWPFGAVCTASPASFWMKPNWYHGWIG